MKKFLSLVLALAMAMSLVVVNTSAKEFTDDADITYDEAVAVVSELGIVDGYTDGSFNPDGGLTRGAAAKIICNLILGPTTAAELHADTAPFSDVSINNEFAGYIAYCAKEGIISGYADGAFRPANPLTGYAFMKMLLGALGYDAETEQYVGENWSINVAKQAIGIGLNNSLEGEFNGVDYVNREEACLYAFNTLQSTMVAYDSRITANVNGAEVVISDSNAKPVEWSEGINRDGNIKDDNFVQFAEEYFPKLYLDNTQDAFGRPSRQWEYDGVDVGTYVNYDILVDEYTTKVTGKDLYDLLGRTTIDTYETYVYIDGENDVKVNPAIFLDADMNKNNNDGVGATGNGVLTQVFLDTENKEITVAIINTYLAIADSDYNEKRDEASFTVYELAKKSDNLLKTDGSAVTLKASAEDFDLVKDATEDAAYLVNVAEGEIQIIADAEVLAETEITAFKKGSNVTADGEKYDYANTACYDTEVLDQYTSNATGTVNLKDIFYNIYLDQYGYLIGVDEVEAADNYLFITGIDLKNSSLGNRTAEAAAIFLDGTMKTIQVNMTKSTLDTTGDTALINSWCTYTVNNDEVYTVKEVVTAAGATTIPGGSANSSKIAQYHETYAGANALDNRETMPIDQKNISLMGRPDAGSFNRVYGNDSTVYLTAELTEIIDNHTNYGIINDVASVTTGVKNANLNVYETVYAQAEAEDSKVAGTVGSGDFAEGVYTLYKSNGYVIAAVVVGEDSAASKNLVYVHSSDVESESYDKSTGLWTWTRKVVFNGEETLLTEVSDSSTYLESMAQYNWYQVKLNSNNEVIGCDLAKNVLANATVNGASGDLGEYVAEAYDVAASVNRYDTVLYHEGVQHSKPSMIGSTLFAHTQDTTGFFVAEDVNIVLIQYNRNKLETSFESGSNRLQTIIETLNQDHDGNTYNYTISAILEDGAATTVVIRDDSNPYEVVPVGGGVAESAVLDNLNPATLTGDIKIIDRVGAEKTALQLAVEALTNAGYEYKYQDASGKLVALMGDRLYSFTMVIDNAYLVDLKVSPAVSSYVNRLSSTQLWVCKNTAATFTVTLNSGLSFNAGDTAAVVESSTFTVNWAKAPVGGEGALDVTIQFSGTPAANQDATFLWTW